MKCKGTNRHKGCPKYLAKSTFWKHKVKIPEMGSDATAQGVMVTQPVQPLQQLSRSAADHDRLQNVAGTIVEMQQLSQNVTLPAPLVTALGLTAGAKGMTPGGGLKGAALTTPLPFYRDAMAVEPHVDPATKATAVKDEPEVQGAGKQGLSAVLPPASEPLMAHFEQKDLCV
jgi:hypothetical protein